MMDEDDEYDEYYTYDDEDLDNLHIILEGSIEDDEDESALEEFEKLLILHNISYELEVLNHTIYTIYVDDENYTIYQLIK